MSRIFFSLIVDHRGGSKESLIWNIRPAKKDNKSERASCDTEGVGGGGGGEKMAPLQKPEKGTRQPSVSSAWVVPVKEKKVQASGIFWDKSGDIDGG